MQIFRDDASWIRYDRTLGPQLRRTASLSVAYYGFTTTSPPEASPSQALPVSDGIGLSYHPDQIGGPTGHLIRTRKTLRSQVRDGV